MTLRMPVPSYSQRNTLEVLRDGGVWPQDLSFAQKTDVGVLRDFRLAHLHYGKHYPTPEGLRFLQGLPPRDPRAELALAFSTFEDQTGDEWYLRYQIIWNGLAERSILAARAFEYGFQRLVRIGVPRGTVMLSAPDYAFVRQTAHHELESVYLELELLHSRQDDTP